jgi:hypothetical protein
MRKIVETLGDELRDGSWPRTLVRLECGHTKWVTVRTRDQTRCHECRCLLREIDYTRRNGQTLTINIVTMKVET